jgi:thymidylate kinase
MWDIKHILIEGIDRIGKTTIINEFINLKPEFKIIKCNKPIITKRYKTLYGYQKQFFIKCFEKINKIKESDKEHYIFDRSHIGEMVYSPIYRNYSGQYVLDLEKKYNIINNTCLILLVVDNFDFLIDDGNSFNFRNKKIEQDLFIKAFEKSNIKNKKIITVNKNNKFKNKIEIIRTLFTWYSHLKQGERS